MTEQFTAERGKTGLMKLKSNKLRGAVATLHYGHMHKDLLSAAPELLALAKAIALDPYALTPDQWASEARIAIDKAEGRGKL